MYIAERFAIWCEPFGQFAMVRLRGLIALALSSGLLAGCGESEGNDNLIGQIVDRYNGTGYFQVTDSAYLSTQLTADGHTNVTARIQVKVLFSCRDLNSAKSFPYQKYLSNDPIAAGITAYATQRRLYHLFGETCIRGDVFDLTSFAVFDQMRKGWLMSYEVSTSSAPHN